MSVGRSVREVYCGKTADLTWMPFGVVSVVGRGIGVLDGMEIVEGEWAVLRGVNFGRPIVTNGNFVAKLGESDALLPNYFGEDMFKFFTE